jgi:hypothetical protein
MTRISEPFPTSPHRRPAILEDTAPRTVGNRAGWANQQGVNTTRRRRRLRSRAIILSVGVALLLGAVASYFAYRNHLFDVPTGSDTTAERYQSMKSETVIFSGQADQLSAASGNAIQVDPSDASIVWIRSSLTVAKSGGATEGVSIKVPSPLSGALEAKRILVTVSAARDDRRAPSPFAVAYSTGGAGNSGWRVFEPTPEFKNFTFSYVVPRKAAGLTHYVGIWSDIAGRGAPLAIRRVTITVP